MRFPKFVLAAVGAAAMFLGGCATSPPPAGPDRTQLHTDSDAAMSDFKTQDPSLDNLMRNSYAYAIFPSVGKGAVGVGGAYGQGEVFEQGKLIGYVEMQQAEVGAAIGGVTYAELVVFRTPDALHKFENGEDTVTADATAVAAKAGAADSAKWANDVLVFCDVKGGFMGEVSVGGQKFNFQASNTPQ
jgi:lipid-binding SYLF domain-containing protein